MKNLTVNGHKIEYITHPDIKNTWVYVKIDGTIEANLKSLELAEAIFDQYDNRVRDHHRPLPGFEDEN